MKKKVLSYLTLATIICATVFTLSSFQDGPDYAEDNGVAGRCYSVMFYECPGGATTGTQCNFTGLYGSPYSCTSFPCTYFPGPPPQPTTRICVLRIPPPPAPPM